MLLFLITCAMQWTLDPRPRDSKDGPDVKTSNSQSRRAASLCFSAIKFASSLKHETIVPDSFRGKPLCMDQFRVGSEQLFRQPIRYSYSLITLISMMPKYIIAGFVRSVPRSRDEQQRHCSCQSGI